MKPAETHRIWKY